MIGHKHRTATIIWRWFLNPICATRSKTTWDCLGSHLPKSPICSDIKLSSRLQVVNIRIAGSNLKTQNKTCLLEAQPNRKCISFLLTRDVYMKPSIAGGEMRTFSICLVWPSCSDSELTGPSSSPNRVRKDWGKGWNLELFWGRRGGEREVRGGQSLMWLHLHSWPFLEQSHWGTRSVSGRQHYCASLCVLH